MNSAEMRREFPVTQVCAYLESGYHGPFPASGARAMSAYVERWSLQPYPDGRVGEWLEWAEGVRAKIASLLRVTPEEILFTRSTTDGLHLVANSLLKPGDEILVGGLEHPADYITWMNLADRGIEVTVVPHRDGGMAVADLAAAVGPRTRAIGMNLVNTYNGYREDLPGLSQLCSERGLYLLLDAIKAVGHLDIDLESSAVTALCAGVYKFLCSPEGLGIAYVNGRVLGDIAPGTPHLYKVHPRDESGWGSFTQGIFQRGYERAGPQTIAPNSLHYPPDTKRLETSMNFLGLAGLEAMVDLLLQAGGMAAVEKRVLELSAYLRASVQDHGHAVLSSQSPQHLSGMTLVGVPDADRFVSYCEDRDIYVRPGSTLLGDQPGVRVSPHVFNNEEDLDRFVEALDAFVASGA